MPRPCRHAARSKRYAAGDVTPALGYSVSLEAGTMATRFSFKRAALPARSLR
jgi:hypothetical protein